VHYPFINRAFRRAALRSNNLPFFLLHPFFSGESPPPLEHLSVDLCFLSQGVFLQGTIRHCSLFSPRDMTSFFLLPLKMLGGPSFHIAFFKKRSRDFPLFLFSSFLLERYILSPLCDPPPPVVGFFFFIFFFFVFFFFFFFGGRLLHCLPESKLRFDSFEAEVHEGTAAR